MRDNRFLQRPAALNRLLPEQQVVQLWIAVAVRLHVDVRSNHGEKQALVGGFDFALQWSRSDDLLQHGFVWKHAALHQLRTRSTTHI